MINKNGTLKHTDATSDVKRLLDSQNREVFFEDAEQSIHTIWITSDVIQTIWVKKSGNIIHRLSNTDGEQLMSELFRTKFTHDDTVSIKFLPEIKGRIIKIELTGSQTFYDIEVESKEGFERLYHINENKLEMVESKSYDTSYRALAFHNLSTELPPVEFPTQQEELTCDNWLTKLVDEILKIDLNDKNVRIILASKIEKSTKAALNLPFFNQDISKLEFAIAHYERLSQEGSNQAYVVAKFLKSL